MAKPNPCAKKAPPSKGKETAKEGKAEGKKMPPWMAKKGPAMKKGGKVGAC